MTPVIRNLKQLLNTHLIREGDIVLQETASTNRCKEITLDRGSISTLVLHPDQLCQHLRPPPLSRAAGGDNERVLPYFNPTEPGLSSLCDYIIFADASTRESSQLFVLLCELKSGRPDAGRLQVENGRLLAEYILSMIAHHSQLTMPTAQYRAVVFSPRVKPFVGNLNREPCPYEKRPGKLGLSLAYYRDDEEYPLSHFLV